MKSLLLKSMVFTLAASAVTLPSLAVTAPSTGCAQVEVIGARGTGEPSGLGYLLTPIASAIQSGSTKTVGTYAVPYPASYDYESSEQTGVSDVENYLKSESQSCPNQTFVLLGYSQGAQVVNDALASGVLNSISSRIVAVAVYGDPTFNSAESFDQGTYKKGVNGVLGARKTGSLKTFASDLQSYCNGDDGICQAGQSIAGHLEYQQTAASISEQFVLGKIGR